MPETGSDGTNRIVSTVHEITAAITRLPAGQYSELERWWEEHRERLWDEQLAKDSAPGGRLSGLLADIDADIDAGKVRPLEL